jgi:hypothetical protein
MTQHTEPDVTFSDPDIRNLGTDVRVAYDRLSKDGSPPDVVTIKFTGDHELFGDAVVQGAMYSTPVGECQAVLLAGEILRSKGGLDGGSFQQNFDQYGDVLVYHPGELLQ